MRLVTYFSGSGTRPGLITKAGRIVDLAAAFSFAQDAKLLDQNLTTPADIIAVIAASSEIHSACKTLAQLAESGELPDAAFAPADARLAAPIPRPLKNVFCVGSNYKAHVTEASRAQNKEDKTPKLPVFFTKPPTAVIGPDGYILRDPALSEKMDYEVELGVIIGKPGRNIRAADAFDHIFGFTIINDVTARDLQRAHGGQFLKGKGLDTTCPMGPHIVTIDELANFEDLSISLTVNGELRQEGNTGNMIFPIARLIESLSEGLTLEAGDVLATGTPSGVGYAMDPPQFLKDGDNVTCKIEGIGLLTSLVRNADSPVFST